MRALRRNLFYAGLVAGPLAWGATFQTAYSLVSAECGNGSSYSLATTVAGVLIAVAGAGASWSSRGAFDVKGPRYFMATIASAAGGLFAIVILLQMAAAFIFEGCEL
jgi:hypothetical protein